MRFLNFAPDQSAGKWIVVLDIFGNKNISSQTVIVQKVPQTIYPSIPHPGVSLHAEFEYRAKQESKNDSENKRERIFQVLLVFLGAIIGLFIERISGITAWISSFF